MRLALATALAVGAVVVALGAAVFGTYWTRINAGADDNLRLFLTVVVVAGAAAIVSAVLLGWLAGRAASHGLGRMAREVRALGDGASSRPLEVPGGRSELVQLATALNASLERLRETSRGLSTAAEGQRRFLGEASRAMRAPLASLTGSLHALGRPDLLGEERRSALEGSLADVDAITRLVDGLDVLGRVDRVSIGRTHFDWGPLLELALSRGRQLCAPRPVAVDISPSLTSGRGDPALLQELFRILLSNVAMHTPPTTTVLVAARQSAADRDELTVSDDGPGVPPAMRRTMFDPFVSGDPRRSPGLGLAIARAIVTAHDGIIDAEPNTPRGLRVRIDLPHGDATSRGPGRMTTARGSEAGPRPEAEGPRQAATGAR